MTREQIEKITRWSPFRYDVKNFINSIVADGEITEKERAALRKIAEEADNDADAAEIYADGVAEQVRQILQEEALARKEKASSGLFLDEHDLNLFIKETRGKDIEYYKLKNTYLLENLLPSKHGVNAIQIRFIDVTRRDDIEIENRHKYKGLYMLVSLKKSRRGDKTPRLPKLEFLSGKDEVLSLETYDSYIRDFQDQTINGKSADITRDFKIDEENLKVLCEVPNLMLKTADGYKSDEWNEYFVILPTLLKGFQQYARYFYRIMIDKTAYPETENGISTLLSNDAETSKDDVNGDSHQEEEPTLSLTGQQLAGILSRKISAKRISPTPHFMSQFSYKNMVITDVVATANASEKTDIGTPGTIYANLHAISEKNSGPKFYLCLSSDKSYLKDKELSLTTHFHSYELEPVAKNKSYFSSKHRNYKDGFYNYYPLEQECIKELIEKKAEFNIVCDVSTFECKSIPSGWRKAFEMLTPKNKLKQWRASKKETFRSKLGAFLETYFHWSTLDQWLIIIGIIGFFIVIILGLCGVFD